MSEKLFFERLQLELESMIGSFRGTAGITVIDLVNGNHLGVNEDVVFSTASSIKVPLLTALYMRDNAGELSVKTPFTVDKRHYVGGSGVLQFYDHPTTMAVEDIASMMINVSDNIATNILIELVGMDYVNKMLDSMGLHTIRLQRKMIDQMASVRGEENVATTKDAAELMRRLYAGEIVNREVCDRVLRILKKPKRQTPIARLLPQDVVIASKPGGLEGVSVEFGIVYLERRPYVFVCMTNYAVDDEPADFVADVSLEVFEYMNVLNRSTSFGHRLPLERFR
jgi:beta-lactamase class A